MDKNEKELNTNDELKRLESLLPTIENQYSQLQSYVKESDSIIDELKDRLVRQRENRNTFISSMQKLSAEYTDVVNRINELKTSSEK